MVHAVIGSIFLCCEGYLCIIIFVTVMVFYGAMRLKRRYIWLLGTILLTGRQLVPRVHDIRDTTFISPSKLNEFLMIYAGLLVRLISYSVDYNRASQRRTVRQKEMQRYSMPNYLGYAFYMPVLVCGPPLIFGRYANSSRYRKCDDFPQRLSDLFIELSKVTVNAFIMEFARNFIYAQFFSNNPQVSHLRTYTCRSGHTLIMFRCHFRWGCKLIDGRCGDLLWRSGCIIIYFTWSFTV